MQERMYVCVREREKEIGRKKVRVRVKSREIFFLLRNNRLIIN